MIDSYSFGCLNVDGRAYRSDIIVLPHMIVADWRRQNGHLLQLADIEQYLIPLPDVIVVGTGKLGMMRIAEDLERHLCSRLVTLTVERTGKAWRTFNHHLRIGNSAVGAFHVTC